VSAGEFDIATFVKRTTEASGVPRYVEDPGVIEAVAAILRGAEREPERRREAS
jgi:hypothetical protein